MIRSALRLLSVEVRGLHAAVFVLAFSSFLSSLLALARDRILAHVFGAGPTLDVYNAAFRLPDLIFVGTGALVSVYILIPELARRSEAAQKEYLDTILAGFSLFACAVALMAGVFAPAILAFLFPQFVADGTFDTLVLLTRIMLLQPILLGLSNILAAITQSRNRYTLYSISPLLYNVAIIFGVVVLYPVIGLSGLAWGVVLGAFLHVAIQVPSIMHDGFLTHLPRIWETRSLFKTAFISMPRALTLSMAEIAELGLIALAGLLAPGSIAIFVFAYNLQAVPLGVIGASYSTAAFPTLAAALSRGETDTFIDHVATAARYVLFWSLPATTMILVLRAYLVRVVLGSGHFDWTDTRLTAAVFALLALALAAQGLSLLLIRAYYAAGRTFVPFFVSCGTAVVTLGLAVIFLGVFKNNYALQHIQDLMRLSDVAGSQVISLGLAYALASILGTCALVVMFERRFGGFVRRISSAWWYGIIASLAALAATYVVLVALGPLDVGSTTGSVFFKGLVGGLSGIIVAGIAYWVLGSRELNDTYLSVYGRYFRHDLKPAQGGALATALEDQPGQS